MKCPLCRSRKGKRRCPALRAEICAACCGEKRIVEIACPPDCRWLAEGQRHEMLRGWEDYARHQEPAKTRRWLAALQGLLPLLDAVEQAIVAAAGDGALGDEELSEALSGLRQEFASRDSGLIYQPASPSPRVEAVRREIRGAIEELGRSLASKEGGGLPEGAVVRCLEVLIDRVEFHRARPDRPALAAHLRRIRPRGRPGEEPQAAPRIVLP